MRRVISLYDALDRLREATDDGAVGIEVGGHWPGLSRPPLRWHTGPLEEPARGAPVWYIMPAEQWPDYVVCRARFQSMVAASPYPIARLATDKEQVEVGYARLFVTRSEAEQEARILTEFASGQRTGTTRSYKLVVPAAKKREHKKKRTS